MTCRYCMLQLAIAPEREGSRASMSFMLHSGDRLMQEGVLTQFGDYELECEIARGGMGVVYRARQLSLNRVVAVKLILAGQLASPESVRRFRMEAETAARLHHPGIVPIYEIGEHETQHFFSMELVDGVSLAECLDEFRLSPDASQIERRRQELCIAELLARVARALDFAHQHGVLHRDLKPSNILIDEHGQPRLTDFGLAKLTGREASGLTISNMVLGTPGYLAPEQAAGRPDGLTTAVDVYGLGATLYELLTGRPPFSGATALETMKLALETPPAGPRQLNPGIHRDMETIALKCLEKQPQHRYRSAASVADELERFIRRQPIQARPISRAEHLWRWCQRSPAIASMVGALVIAVLVGSAAVLSQWRRAEQAEVVLRENVAHLEWGAIDDMLGRGESYLALAKIAALLGQDPEDRNAAMMGMSVLEQRRFPVPAAPLIRHPEWTELSAARISPDGRRVATASFDGTARIWDTATSLELVPPLVHQGAVMWIEFSPDGRSVATASEDKTVRLWDPLTGKPLTDPLLQDDAVRRVQFSPDGRYLMARTERTVTIRDAGDGHVLVGPIEHDAEVTSARFLAGGKAFFAAKRVGDSPRLRIWDLPDGQLRTSLQTDLIWDADISDDMTRAVATDHAGRAWVWDLTLEKPEPRQLITRNGHMLQVKFGSSRDRVLTVGQNHWARVWDSTSTLPISPELDHYFLLSGASFVDGGRSVLTWGADSLARVWDAVDGKPVCEPMRHEHRVNYAEESRAQRRELYLTTQSHLRFHSADTRTGAAQLWEVHRLAEPSSLDAEPEEHIYDSGRLSDDGKWAVVCSSFYHTWVIDVASGKPVCGPIKILGGAWCTMFTPDRSRLITASSVGEVSIWSLPDGKPVGTPVKLDTSIWPGEMAPDGRHFATGSRDGMVRLWDVATGQIVRELRHGSVVNALNFAPDGRLLASVGADRIVRLWDVVSGALVRELKGHQNEIVAVAFSPDSRRIVSASHDFTARVWNVATGSQLFVLAHQGEVVDADFSPDGRYIATGSRDRTAVIWDAVTGLAHSRDLRHEQAVRYVRFSPDSQRLATADLKGLRLWDVVTGHPVTTTLSQLVSDSVGIQSSSVGPAFTPDGQNVFLAAGSPRALLWHVPVPPTKAPQWFGPFLEAVAGERLMPGTDRPELVPSDRFLKLAATIRSSADQDYYTRWAQQWLKDPLPPTAVTGGSK